MSGQLDSTKGTSRGALPVAPQGSVPSACLLGVRDGVLLDVGDQSLELRDGQALDLGLRTNNGRHITEMSHANLGLGPRTAIGTP